MATTIEPNQLLTPRDWAATKRMQACDVLGTPEAATLLADARKFDLLADERVALYAEVVRLNALVEELQQAPHVATL